VFKRDQPIFVEKNLNYCIGFASIARHQKNIVKSYAKNEGIVGAMCGNFVTRLD